MWLVVWWKDMDEVREFVKNKRTEKIQELVDELNTIYERFNNDILTDNEMDDILKEWIIENIEID